VVVSHPGWSDAYPEELLGDLQDTLAKLADIQDEFDRMHELLAGRPGSEATKAQTFQRLAERRDRQRDPFVQHLATLHDRMFKAVLYRDLIRLAA